MSFNVKKEEKDDIKEFKDLFSLGANTFKTNQTNNQNKIDLTYNPGVPISKPQEQPKQESLK